MQHTDLSCLSSVFGVMQIQGQLPMILRNSQKDWLRLGGIHLKRTKVFVQLYFKATVELDFLLVPGTITRRFGELASTIQHNNLHPAVVSTLTDLSGKVKGMYRLLDLIEESGSNGYGKRRPSYADSLG